MGESSSRYSSNWGEHTPRRAFCLGYVCRIFKKEFLWEKVYLTYLKQHHHYPLIGNSVQETSCYCLKVPSLIILRFLIELKQHLVRQLPLGATKCERPPTHPFTHTHTDTHTPWNSLHSPHTRHIHSLAQFLSSLIFLPQPIKVGFEFMLPG